VISINKNLNVISINMPGQIQKYLVAKQASCFNYQLNAQFLYSITIYMLHCNPRRVSSSTMLIFRRTNYIFTASGIVTLRKQLFSTTFVSGLQSALNRCTEWRVAIPDAVIIQFALLKMGMVLLETCRGL
jgi:hypothetical protein